MTHVSTLQEAMNDVRFFANTIHPPDFVKAKFNQLGTVHRRFLAPAIVGTLLATGAKMTDEECQQADAILAEQPVQLLLKALELLETGYEMINAPQSSRSNYRSNLNWYLDLAKQRPWWPCTQTINIQNQCCPPRYISGRRHYSDLPLTERTGQYKQYRLTEAETSPALQAQLDDLYRFCVAPVYLGRVREVIKCPTANTYLKDVRLMLGRVHRHLGVPLEDLRLEHLIPLITDDHLEGLSKKQQEALWYEYQLYVESWVNFYFESIKSENNSLSPRTKNGKLSALQRVAYYLYRRMVRRLRDYDSIPMLITLATMISQVNQEIQKWKRTKTTVADLDLKWPDVVEGETALTTVRRLVVEPHRLQTRPRRKNGAYRDGDVIAKFYQHYLKWALTTDLPARRQCVYREAKVVLSCPIERPESVPADGYYFPLPPNGIREKNHDGTLADNYLYKVYLYQGKVYPDGLWILQVCADKEEDVYGIYSMEIPNRVFDDGTCFYEYIENYLCGYWVTGQFRNRYPYSWWDAKLQGQVGRWLTKGWMEFDAKETYAVEERQRGPVWRWGYLLPLPETGEVGDGTSFAGSFERSAYQLIGKRVTPHLIRNFWATWAFQVKLTEHEVASLAYAMGHSVTTLRDIYDRCTPDEKNRPIYEAIDRLLFQRLEEPPEPIEPITDPLRIVEELRKLSPADRQKVMKLAM